MGMDAATGVSKAFRLLGSEMQEYSLAFPSPYIVGMSPRPTIFQIPQGDCDLWPRCTWTNWELTTAMRGENSLLELGISCRAFPRIAVVGLPRIKISVPHVSTEVLQ